MIRRVLSPRVLHKLAAAGDDEGLLKLLHVEDSATVVSPVIWDDLWASIKSCQSAPRDQQGVAPVLDPFRRLTKMQDLFSCTPMHVAILNGEPPPTWQRCWLG